MFIDKVNVHTLSPCMRLAPRAYVVLCASIRIFYGVCQVCMAYNATTVCLAVVDCLFCAAFRFVRSLLLVDVSPLSAEMITKYLTCVWWF
jgi:hypothetical protein